MCELVLYNGVEFDQMFNYKSITRQNEDMTIISAIFFKLHKQICI